MLSDADRKRITDAVMQAEHSTSGEIYCVLTHEVSHYREVPVTWAAIIALLLPPVALLFGLHPTALTQILPGWTAVQFGVVDNAVLRALSAYAVIQALLFALTALVVSIPSVRRVLTPSLLKRHRVRQVAMHHFVSAGVHLAETEPHVLIYAALIDRQVEIVAAEAIHRTVGGDVWAEATAAVTAAMRARDAGGGFVRAIEIVGAALATHFPPNGAKRNIFPDAIAEV
jgi:putative membrane protein